MESIQDLSNIIFEHKDDLKTGLFKKIYEKLMNIYKEIENEENFKNNLIEEVEKISSEKERLICALTEKLEILDTIQKVMNYKQGNKNHKKTYNFKLLPELEKNADNLFGKEFGYVYKKLFKIININDITTNNYITNPNDSELAYLNKRIKMLLKDKNNPLLESFVKHMKQNEVLYPIDVRITDCGLKFYANDSIYKYYAALECGYKYIPVYIHYKEETPLIYNPRLPKTIVDSNNLKISNREHFQDSKKIKNTILPIGTIFKMKSTSGPFPCYKHLIGRYFMILGGLYRNADFVDYYTQKTCQSYSYLCIPMSEKKTYYLKQKLGRRYYDINEERYLYHSDKYLMDDDVQDIDEYWESKPDQIMQWLEEEDFQKYYVSDKDMLVMDPKLININIIDYFEEKFEAYHHEYYNRFLKVKPHSRNIEYFLIQYDYQLVKNMMIYYRKVKEEHNKKLKEKVEKMLLLDKLSKIQSTQKIELEKFLDSMIDNNQPKQ